MKQNCLSLSRRVDIFYFNRPSSLLFLYKSKLHKRTPLFLIDSNMIAFYLISIFSGTVKENLDPVGFYSLRQISDVIKRCKLDSLISKLGGESAEFRIQNFSARASFYQVTAGRSPSRAAASPPARGSSSASPGPSSPPARSSL